MDKTKNIVSASLHNIRSSPRKMRIIVDLIRNKKIEEALDILSYCKRKKKSIILKKLLYSVLSNWEIKNHDSYFAKTNNFFLYISDIRVNQGKTLKRIRPVPQGRGHRIRKKFSSVIVFLQKKENKLYGTKN
ncbi:50S ribosomal protein L22 [Blattabacterium cuenoti]|uniref:50S ribosomal protein L22 n=1 Tax=Blattabacterium cuenoti TaxID=1653831 RepID=UPI00163C722C|nr:50S ribosomal protein L22 [Blattabacterium cuenoti]